MSTTDPETSDDNTAADHQAVLNGHGKSASSPTSPNFQRHHEPKESSHWIRRPFLLLAIGIKWLPVFFIAGVICWSYYAFVVALCLFTIESIVEKVLLIIFYHGLLSLFVASYLMTIFTPAAVTPSRWFLSTAMVDKLNKAKSETEWKNLLEMFVVEMELPVVQRSVQGAIRYCEKCRAVKPDRSHHCSVCANCVLKMDHHCPWVNNCVAFSNYKFFMLFLGYALLYCTYLVGCVFKYFIWFWTGELPGNGTERFHILFLFFVAIMFFISVSSLFWYHVYLIANNRTTLEQFRAPAFAGGASDENGWSLGKFNNFQEVFGDNKWTWFLPVPTSIGDGLTFPTRLNSSSMMDGTTSYQSIAARADADVEAGLATTSFQNGGSSGGNRRSTEVVIDSKDRVSVKVKEMD